MTSRLSLALVAAIALVSGRAYAASGGPGIVHDDTSYPTASTWGGAVTLEAVPQLTHDDTRYPAAHTTIHKELLPAQASGSLAIATADDTVYPTADLARTPARAPQASEREQERVACGCPHACDHC